MPKEMSRTRRLLSSIFKIKTWLDLDRIREITKSLYAAALRLFTPPTRTPDTTKKQPRTEQTEAFERAKNQYHLNKKELSTKQQALLYSSYCMVVFSLLLLALFFYYLIAGSIKASLLTLMGVGLAVVLAFRYHYFYYQIKQRKLGCTIKEWFQEGLLGRK